MKFNNRTFIIEWWSNRKSPIQLKRYSPGKCVLIKQTENVACSYFCLISHWRDYLKEFEIRKLKKKKTDWDLQKRDHRLGKVSH